MGWHGTASAGESVEITMDIFRGAERLMAMDEAAWARHANPWSVYSRFTCLPLIVVAIWSRVWIGGWAVVPLIGALGWTFLNPRLFSAPLDKTTWAAKAVMGERLFLARKARPVPSRHVTMALWLTGVSGAGAIVLIYGLVVLNVWATVTALAVTMCGKLWFCDRMVWLFEDMERAVLDEAAACAVAPD